MVVIRLVQRGGGGGGGGTIVDMIQCVMEPPQSTGAYPDVRSLATQVSKITGMVLPTDVDGTINFKVKVPNALHSTPAATLRIWTITLAANTSDAINLTLNMRFTGDTENADQAFDQTVAATNYSVSDTIESLDVHDIDFPTEPVAEDLITGQIFRDVSADVASDVIVVGIALIITRGT